MFKQSYYCCKCGKMYFIPVDSKIKYKCDFCSGNIAKTAHVIFEEHYQELLRNEQWDTNTFKYYCPCTPPNVYPRSEVTPKCPTCGCTEIRKISATEKAVNIGIFGLLGNKRTYQFECLNPACKYKW